MSFINDLRDKSKGFKYDSRKQHMKSMEALAEEGFQYMEIRSTEIKQDDLDYFESIGFQIKVRYGDYKYYRLIWGNIKWKQLGNVDKVERVAEEFLLTSKLLLRVAIFPFQVIFTVLNFFTR